MIVVINLQSSNKIVVLSSQQRNLWSYRIFPFSNLKLWRVDLAGIQEACPALGQPDFWADGLEKSRGDVKIDNYEQNKGGRQTVPVDEREQHDA
jgi:hypothetical protein